MRRILLILFCTVSFVQCRFANDPADLIVHNAIIYTMDEVGTTYEAMAIKDGKIIALGPEREILNQYNAPKMVDARKRSIFPGFYDGHCHFLAYGLMAQDADLTMSTSWNEILERLVEHNKSTKKEWIIGRGWDQNDWTTSNPLAEEKDEQKEFPDRTELDKLFPNTPVYLTRIDGHAVIVNEAALSIAGITPNTKVEGGYVEVKDGRCTGILVDNAIALVDAVIPPHTREEKILALQDAQKMCFEAGLTSIADAGLMWDDIALIDSLQKSQMLKIRVYAMLSDDEENYKRYLNKPIDTTNQYLNVRSFKLYADGALGSRGACLLTPYEDILKELGRKDYGFLLNTPVYYQQRANEIYAAGYQMNTHAIGDSANRVILNIYANTLKGTNDRRWRIEHAQVVNKVDIDKFRFYNIIPSVQPTHATSDMPWAWIRLGNQRLQRAYAYKELLEQNGMIALGTDFPVEGISPISTFYAAVVRKDKAGKPDEGFLMQNALTRSEALMGMTVWNAVAAFEDTYKGTIQVGKVADFVMLDRDLMKCDESKILDTKVELTVLQGEVVFSR